MDAKSPSCCVGSRPHVGHGAHGSCTHGSQPGVGTVTSNPDSQDANQPRGRTAEARVRAGGGQEPAGLSHNRAEPFCPVGLGFPI